MAPENPLFKYASVSFCCQRRSLGLSILCSNSFCWETLQQYCASLPNSSPCPYPLQTADLERAWRNPTLALPEVVRERCKAVRLPQPQLTWQSFASSWLFCCFPTVLTKTKKNNLSISLRKGETLIGIPKWKSFPLWWRWFLQSRTCACSSLWVDPLGEGLNGSREAMARGQVKSTLGEEGRDQINVKIYLYQSRSLLAKEISVWKCWYLLLLKQNV